MVSSIQESGGQHTTRYRYVNSNTCTYSQTDKLESHRLAGGLRSMEGLGITAQESHFSGRNPKTLAVGKLYDQTEKVAADQGFSEYVLDWVGSSRLRMLNESSAKANLFDLFGLNAVAGNVFNSILRPIKLANLHRLILDHWPRGRQ